MNNVSLKKFIVENKLPATSIGKSVLNKNIYEINLSNKSTPINNRKAEEFSKYYDLIWKDIDYHV